MIFSQSNSTGVGSNRRPQAQKYTNHTTGVTIFFNFPEKNAWWYYIEFYCSKQKQKSITVRKATVPSINVKMTLPIGSQLILSAVPDSWSRHSSVLNEEIKVQSKITLGKPQKVHEVSKTFFRHALPRHIIFDKKRVMK